MVREQALVIDCDGEALVGILHHPPEHTPQAAQATGVVVIVGGPQYRAGSHRQFVHLARALAAAGHAVLRFDVQGMGDSTGDPKGFERITPEIGAAVDALQQHAPQVRQVVLWGLCDGASAALLYLDDRADARVRGLCLLNPWVRSEASLARTHVKHYYLQRLGQREFWSKVLRGAVGGTALRDLALNLGRSTKKGGRMGDNAAFPGRMLAAWTRFDGPALLVLSGRDYTAKEFSERIASDARWRSLIVRANVERRQWADADHTFSSRHVKDSMAQQCAVWLAQQFTPPEQALSHAPTEQTMSILGPLHERPAPTLPDWRIRDLNK